MVGYKSRRNNGSSSSSGGGITSLLARISKETADAVADAYGSLVLGDEAGKEAKVVLVVRPSSRSRLRLGMTFLEINGRAYVKSITPGLAAHQAGILPRDVVQFAAVYKQAWIDEQRHQDDGMVDADETAKSFAMESEKRGMRVSYEELRTMLQEGTDVTHCFTSVTSNNNNSNSQQQQQQQQQKRQQLNNFHSSSRSWKGPPIPATINVCAPRGYYYDDEEEDEDDDDDDDNHTKTTIDEEDYLRLSSPYNADAPRPVVFVFRRTRQRPTHSLLHFRLDDECDFASSLIRRLAPTADMDMPAPDAWEELVHDGTDWLLGSGSMLPPKHTSPNNHHPKDHHHQSDSIPYDSFEEQRATKLAKLRARMAAETPHHDRTEDVEASTLRGMIQKAVGLAFVRSSKVVLGVSIHGGTGVVIARLPDGTWSAPSCIGTWGLGLGVQFGLEVAEYIFILQTQESLEHFRKGGSFTIGGNVGAAIAGVGREAYGAASVGNVCASHVPPKEDEYDHDDNRSSLGIAPIVAYAKSQGLYIGVSLEGSRIFTRHDMNARSYKFAMGRDVSAYDILSGKVATPPEAEDLYASLHSVEFTHEMSCLPRPPQLLRKDSPNPWQYDRCTLCDKTRGNPFGFLHDLSPEEADECATFETQFKKFMYGGVSVQRLFPSGGETHKKTRKERRTLWLMLPEVGALRLGFVSKLSDGDNVPVSNKSSTLRAKRDGDASQQQQRQQQQQLQLQQPLQQPQSDYDLGTVASEEVTLDSTLADNKDGGRMRTGNVQLSQKHSVALTDVTTLSQDPPVPIRFNSDDQTEHLRVISVQDVSGKSLVFLANNFREADLLVCGLKLLLERETARLGVRGGLPITALGGQRAGDGAMSPSAARGFSDSVLIPRSSRRLRGLEQHHQLHQQHPDYQSSDMDEEDEDSPPQRESSLVLQRHHTVPEGRKNWGSVPGRNYMRGQAAAAYGETDHEQPISNQRGIPNYVLGQLLVRDIATDVQLPLPLPLCRVLLLDSTSPVIAKWEEDRGDVNFERTDWTFPPATPRELERHSSEHHLIASGSMMGAHRTTMFDRPRNGSMGRLSETQIIDADDSEKLAFTVSERMPRRGFSVKVRILLRSLNESSCEATVLGELRPVGKNMSNQGAVHKAFQVVLREITGRYGTEGKGLMAGFLSVVNTLPSSDLHRKGKNTTGNGKEVSFNPFPRTNEPVRSAPPFGMNGRKDTQRESGLVSLDDMIRKQPDRPSTPSIFSQQDRNQPVHNNKPKSLSSDPTNHLHHHRENGFTTTTPNTTTINNKAVDMEQPVTIEVKPLPKIRLSLMPSPREEDEEESSSEPKVIRKKKKKKSSRRRLSGERRRVNGSGSHSLSSGRQQR